VEDMVVRENGKKAAILHFLLPLRFHLYGELYWSLCLEAVAAVISRKHQTVAPGLCWGRYR
jgi:hypothetical protein